MSCRLHAINKINGQPKLETNIMIFKFSRETITNPEFPVAVEDSSTGISRNTNRFFSIDCDASQTFLTFDDSCVPIAVAYIHLQTKIDKKIFFATSKWIID